MKRTLLYTFVAALLVAVSPLYAAQVSFELDKSTVDIGAFYNGATISCQGIAPQNADVVVRVSGQPEELHLKKKGKAAGFLWMNVGDFTFSNAPKVYMLYTSKGAQESMDDPTQIYSYGALANRIVIEPDVADKQMWFDEFLKLKKHEKTYADYPGSITTTAGSTNGDRFDVQLVIPPRMGRGEYKIEVYAVQNGTIIDQAEKKLTIRQVGFPAKITDLAYNKALLYGIFSVLIALAAGLIMGLLFKDKGGSH